MKNFKVQRLIQSLIGVTLLFSDLLWLSYLMHGPDLGLMDTTPWYYLGWCWINIGIILIAMIAGLIFIIGEEP